MQGAGVGGRLDDHHVAGFEKCTRYQVDDLLGPRGDEQPIGRHLVFQKGRHPFEQDLAQRSVPFRRAVLQQGAAIGAQHVGAVRERLHRKRVRRRQPARERDHAGL